ncbi:class III poly(R)-hydroxyalkanoic acid synthase subunit PhaE [Solemya velesiana gill symbiont]|uniref:Poly(3-hydroxyalkanoate) polymerase subunit PhaE n=1 Tax=Solemya velesiana gill symbiont TaxID=1918948 RepID=A0A1T2KUT2_9GAMM|nr:class III poly(R)-hydroxyalkanoic acid synthase subunit PhaE [Solemya velesiana gill symbiont]OOZ36561.1 class III poly(R)-hydroxyalkanoic acid synthase subunit PhaE [Solemya velesiana gill symbiont]
MSEQGFWNQEWMEIQQKYWQNWSDFSRQALGGKAVPKSPWENAMEHWWQVVSPAAPDMTRDFMDKMMNQGKALFHMADEFSRNFQENGAATEWNDVMSKTFADMKQGFMGMPEAGGDDALHKMMAFWEMPLDNWQRMVSSLSLMPGDMLCNMPHGGHLERFLSAPGLGYTREEQGQQQQMMLKVLEYQQALQDYMQFFSNLGVLAVDRMQTRVGEIVADGKQIDSARQLYDTWVGVCEEAYGEQVMTPEYAKIHGRLVNALMGVKHEMAVMVDESLGAMNMPTRTELRTLQTRMQENRREIKGLKAEIAELKAALASQVAAKPKAAPRKKAAVKKKAAAKR